MEGMHQRMDRAVKEINYLEDDFTKNTRADALGLSNYLAADRFNAGEYEKNLDRNLKQARMAWQENQAKTIASVN